MDLNKRMQDPSQVFDSRWKANHNYQAIKESNDYRRQHFNKMYNIREKEEIKKEILYTTSSEGRLKNLGERMQCANNVNNIEKMNNFRNNFR